MDPSRPIPGSGAPTRGDDRALLSRWWRPHPTGASAIAGLYAVVALAWIAFSDRLVAAMIVDPALHDRVQTVKGTAFVVVTAFLLAALIRRNERATRALGAELRATVDGMADGVLLVDERSVIVEANRAALALVGATSKDEILGPLEEWGRRYEVRTRDGAPMPFERYATVRVLSGEPVAHYDAVLRRADGSDVFVSVAATPVVRAGRPTLAVAVFRDVSSARRLDEMRDEFLATAAHEFKTPLAVIKAYAQLMARREPAEQRPLAVIERQVDRLTRLVEHLLDSSRLRVEDGAGRPERFDLAALATEVVERVRPASAAHQLVLDDPGLVVPVVADRERIERVIGHLLQNAIRFSPGGGAVRLRVETSGGEARVSIADDGVGIPAERQEHVFERYFRAHAGTAEDFGGLGLGLQVSRAVVERHGGRMWFESAPGRGSTFHFGLPLPREDS